MPQIKIDDFIPVNQPQGMDELNVEIQYSETERTLLVDTNGAELIFTGDAYAYFVKSRKENGYNGVHNIELSMLVEGVTFSTVFYGTIYITDCEYDLKMATCTVSVIDAGYNSRIKNNRKMGANFTSPVTKIGLDINTGAVTPARVTLFNPPSSTSVGISLPDRYVYRVQDVLAFLTSFMSDNEIAFRSDFFDDLTTSGTSFGLIRGKNLRDDSTRVSQKISFYKLFLDVSQLFNLILTVQTIDGVQTLRVEPLDYFRDAGIVFGKNTTSEIKRSFMQELLYSTVNIGSLNSKSDNSIGAMNYLPPFDFAKDSYYLASKSNIDNTKTLETTTLVYDSNVIEDIVVNGSRDNDDDWFLMAFDEDTLNFRTGASDVFTNGDYYYNGELTNKSVVGRYRFQGAAVRTVGVPDGDFIGIAGTDIGVDFTTGQYYPAQFNDEQFDPLNLWNTSTNRYTALIEDVVNVSMRLDHRLLALTEDFDCPGDSHNENDQKGYTVAIRIKKNGTEVLDDTGRSFGLKFRRMYHSDPTTNDALRNQSNLQFQLFMEPGDYLEVDYYVVFGYISNTAFFPDSTLQYSGNGVLWDSLEPQKKYIDAKTSVGCLSDARLDMLSACSLIVATQGSINGLPISDETVDGFFVNRFEFEDVLSNKQINDFLNSPQKAMNLKNKELNLDLKVWAYLVSINLKSGKTEFEMINNIANQ